MCAALAKHMPQTEGAGARATAQRSKRRAPTDRLRGSQLRGSRQRAGGRQLRACVCTRFSLQRGTRLARRRATRPGPIHHTRMGKTSARVHQRAPDSPDLNGPRCRAHTNSEQCKLTAPKAAQRRASPSRWAAGAGASSKPPSRRAGVGVHLLAEGLLRAASCRQHKGHEARLQAEVARWAGSAEPGGAAGRAVSVAFGRTALSAKSLVPKPQGRSLEAAVCGSRGAPWPHRRFQAAC